MTIYIICNIPITRDDCNWPCDQHNQIYYDGYTVSQNFDKTFNYDYYADFAAVEHVLCCCTDSDKICNIQKIYKIVRHSTVLFWITE